VSDSYSELGARDRARALLDAGTFRELLDPFQHIESPHLPPQGIVPQSDDGVVVARGLIDNVEAVVLGIEGNYQGGSIGEVNGAKLAGALELALSSAERGCIVRPVLLLDTGGIRLQEANLGILAISEIHAAIIALRDVVPVVGVIAGRIGCFGGMGIAAALCSVLIGSEIGRLGLNGPEVIEQEAGIAEFDSKDRSRVWATIGCRRRFAQDQIDLLVDDDVVSVAHAVREAFEKPPTEFRTRRIDKARSVIANYTFTESAGVAR
jgi:malonate decarboxylase beta subunit